VQRIRSRLSGCTKTGGAVGNHGWHGGRLRIGDDDAVGLGVRRALEDFGRVGFGTCQARWTQASFTGAETYCSSGPGPVTSF
jgi:hypothetical protein